MTDDTISRQAAKDYIDSQKGRPFIGCTIGEAMKIMLDEVPPAQPGWIPTSERTPEKSGNYLVTTPDGQVELRYYSTLYRWNGWVDMVAWMPLPTPYREGGQK